MVFGTFWFEGELCILFADSNRGTSILAVQIGNCQRLIPVRPSANTAIPGRTDTSPPKNYCHYDPPDGGEATSSPLQNRSAVTPMHHRHIYRRGCFLATLIAMTNFIMSPPTMSLRAERSNLFAITQPPMHQRRIYRRGCFFAPLIAMTNFIKR
jgi:hypothetical protein